MAKNLVLGLGGMGGRIVNDVAGELKKRNICANDGNICCAVIDTDTYDQYKLKKTGVGIPILAISKNRPIRTYLDVYEDRGINDWMPTSILYNRESMLDGTAQIRARSRLAFYDTIEDGTIKDLECELDKLINSNGSEKINVTIATSLAGGTGSGIFIQTAMWIRKYFESKNVPVNIKGVFILPDVFIRTIGQIFCDEMECEVLRANAYAAIRELNAITKIKTRSYKPSVPIKLDEVEFDSEKEQDGQPVFDRAYFMDIETSSGLAFNSIVDYEKAVAQTVYAQLFAPSSIGILTRDEPLYGSCGTAKAIYPVDSVFEYCSLRAAKDNLDANWRKIDQNIKAILESEKESGEDVCVRTDPRKEYIRQIEELSDNHLYKIKSDTIEGFMTAFKEKLRDTIKQKDIGRLSEIELDSSWLDDNFELKTIWDARSFVEEKRERLYKFTVDVIAKADRIAMDLADLICPVEMDEVNENDPNSILGLFTKRDEDGQLYFIHPVAIRYLLYRLLEQFEEMMKVGTQLDSIRNTISFNKDEQKYTQEIYFFNNVKTDKEEDALSFLDQKPFLMSKSKFIKQFKRKYLECNKKQVEACNNYVEKTLMFKTANILANRIELLVRVIEKFFDRLDKVYDVIDDHIADNIRKTEGERGNTIFVYASKEEKESLYKSLNITVDDENNDVNRMLANAFYADFCVKENPHADYNKQYAGKSIIQMFMNEIIEAYNEIIRKNYSDEIDLDLYTAVCKSSDLEYKRENGDAEEDSDSRKDRCLRAMEKLVEKIVNNSAPYIHFENDVNGNFGMAMTLWGFSSELKRACPELAHSSHLYRLCFSPELVRVCPNLGTVINANTEDWQNEAYDKSELNCYRAVYGFLASDIDKFNEFDKDCHNYYVSYERIVNKMIDDVAKGDDEALVQTPHLDKTWHEILPYINPLKKEEAEQEFYRSFWLAIAYGMITVNKEGHYRIERTMRTCMGTYISQKLVEYKNEPVSSLDIYKLLNFLRTDSAFLIDIEKYKKMFKNECESKMDIDGMAFLYGKVANDTVIGGIASEGDLNALALVVAYSNNLNSDKQTTQKLVRSLEELCRSIALHKGSNEREAFKYLKNVYNACSMNGKDIEAIAHWEKSW